MTYAIEYAVNCRVCGGEYFESTNPGGRCENCSRCLCGNDMPESDDQAYDSVCSTACQEAIDAQVSEYENVLALRVARRLDNHARSSASRNRLFERDGWVCHLCGHPINRTSAWPASDSGVLDHVIPKSKGGTKEDDNLRAAHALCNNLRSDLDLDVWFSKPGAIPVFAARASLSA